MTTTARALLLPFALLFAACGAQLDANTDDESDALTASPALVGHTVRVTASALNLRSGPSTGYHIVAVMPHNTELKVQAVSGGWVKADYQGHEGWCSATYLADVSAPPPPPPPPSHSGPRDEAISRAESGVGFSYHWGAGAWQPGSSAHGACYGSCPNCSHSGSWGADCSGYVAKVWQVPGPIALSTPAHPFSTYNFRYQTPYWHQISRGSMQAGDALVYHSGGEGHIMLYGSGDSWGWFKAYEAKGCSYGIQHDSRTAGSYYVAIRHNNW